VRHELVHQDNICSANSTRSLLKVRSGVAGSLYVLRGKTMPTILLQLK